MKKSIVLMVALTPFFAFNVLASAPAICESGRSNTGLRAEASTHILENVSTQLKGDYNYSIPPVDKWVRFWSDRKGYLGEDFTNSDSNAYINVAFNPMDLGEHYIWVEESENIMNCSYDIVYVQSLPTSSGSVSGTSTITTIFSGSISPHYQRGLLGQNGSLSISYRNLDLNKTYISYPTTTTHNYKPQCDGSYKITASIHDGNYTKSKVLGYVDYTGGSSCGTPS